MPMPGARERPQSWQFSTPIPSNAKSYISISKLLSINEFCANNENENENDVSCPF
jgi:hypothetical protein